MVCDIVFLSGIVQWRLGTIVDNIKLVVEDIMRIYEDLFSGEEIISDGYKMEWKFEETTAEIEAKMIKVGDDNVDVGCGNAFGGKNEDEDESGPGGAPVEKVVNLVHNHGFSETAFNTKKDWQVYFKEYMGRLKEKVPEARMEAFQKGAKEFATWVIKNWAEITFWTPKDYSIENTLIYSYWKKEDDEAPTFVFFLEGCRVIKV